MAKRSQAWGHPQISVCARGSGEGVLGTGDMAAKGTAGIVAYGSAVKTTPAPRQPLPSRGGAAPHGDLGLERESQALQEGS